MRLALSLVLVLLVANVFADLLEDDAQRFEDFKRRFGRRYLTADEEARHFGFFRKNVKRAALMQRSDPNARFGVTKFSDADPAARRGRISISADSPLVGAKGSAIPTMVDWRDKGAVTPVPDMGQCGDPCSFAVTGVISSMYFLAGHRPLTPLSNQQLTSCVTTNEGCCGCEPDNDYNWIIQDNHGNVATEASYPYNSSDGNVPPCETTGLVNGATITAWSKVSKNEDEVAQWIATHGPLAVIIDADPWQLYVGGVLSGQSCNSTDGPNHMALLVGYNDANPKLPYWIIRNEWGTDWGVDGYIYIQKGVNCNDIVTDSPTTVTPKK
jgi:cysteine peptidase B